jgi:hypothetical protein
MQVLEYKPEYQLDYVEIDGEMIFSKKEIPITVGETRLFKAALIHEQGEIRSEFTFNDLTFQITRLLDHTDNIIYVEAKCINE